MDIEQIKRLSTLTAQLDRLLRTVAQLRLITNVDWDVRADADQHAYFYVAPLVKMVETFGMPAERRFHFDELASEHFGRALKEAFPSLIERAVELAEEDTKVKASKLLRESQDMLQEIEALAKEASGDKDEEDI